MKLTREQLDAFNEQIKRRNPHLYGVGGLGAGQPQPAAAPSLDRDGAQRETRAAGVAYRVALVAHRKRLLDDDNNVGSLKPLRDAVAASLGVDDGDTARITFTCGQVITCGAEGVTVTVTEEKR